MELHGLIACSHTHRSILNPRGTPLSIFLPTSTAESSKDRKVHDLQHRHSNHATPVKENKIIPPTFQCLWKAFDNHRPQQSPLRMQTLWHPPHCLSFHSGQFLTLSDRISSIFGFNIRCLRDKCSKGYGASIASKRTTWTLHRRKG